GQAYRLPVSVLAVFMVFSLTAAGTSDKSGAPTPSADPTTTTQGGSAGATTPGGLAVAPVDVVVLVDESGTIKAPALSQEPDAGAMVGLGELSGQAEVAVVGFAGADGPNQVPFDVDCPLTAVDSPDHRQFLGNCAGKLHTRSEAEGNNTDFVSAIDEAVSI